MSLKTQFLKQVGQRPSTSPVGDDGLRVGVGAPLGSTLSRSLATSSPLLSRAQVFALDFLHVVESLTFSLAKLCALRFLME